MYIRRSARFMERTLTGSKCRQKWREDQQWRRGCGRLCYRTLHTINMERACVVFRHGRATLVIHRAGVFVASAEFCACKAVGGECCSPIL